MPYLLYQRDSYYPQAGGNISPLVGVISFVFCAEKTLQCLGIDGQYGFTLRLMSKYSSSLKIRRALRLTIRFVGAKNVIHFITF